MPVPVISITQMREWERATWATGQTETEVIRRVGRCVAREAERLSRPGQRILVLAGKGNNGADARGVREHLPDRTVEVLDIMEPATDGPKLEAALGIPPALIIDGLFGIGLNRPLSPEWSSLIQRVNGTRVPVLAVDVPSGLDADTGETHGAAVRAAVTLTVGAPKMGMLRESAWPFVGRLVVAPDVGLIPCPHQGELKWTLPEDFAGFPPPRAAATHKGSYGHLAIIAGSLGYHGAAVLAARGAQRARPGLITLQTTEAAYQAVAPQLASVMVSVWQPTAKWSGRADAILLGPGLAGPEMLDAMKMQSRHIWRDLALPVVADASALDWLSLDAVPRNAVRVITPHPGEAARLLNSTSQQVQADRLAALRNVSRRFGNTWVVLKGHQTLVGRSTGDVYVNPSGNPYLAQGGSGDVLAGYLAGLLVQTELRKELLQTIRYAVWQHGATADYLQATKPNWIVRDLAEALGSQRNEG
jgi:ADP-dependent NAD(P)H-hydrate dehydratase / NAD(P)H-hydrate epimerase